VQLRGLRGRAGLEAGQVFVTRGELGESPLLPALAILGGAALYATMPGKFVIGPSAGAFSVARWVVPGLTVLLLATLLASPPHGRLVRRLGLAAHQVRVGRRALVMTMIGIVSAANAAAIVLLVHLLIAGVHTEAPKLLRAGIHMWCLNVLLFALWFWELDNGGPSARREARPEGRDFLFPQQSAPELGQPGWQPLFLDYLYVSFTNATAFSPTDTMPLSRWAKMLMLVESAASLVLALMVAARAINLLK
jgi:uncharacterized membrane protein